MDRGLKAFLAVAREGSITGAASTIHLAQSSVTKRVAALEAELGTPLFNRDRRGMSLTEAGERFFTRAERIERISRLKSILSRWSWAGQTSTDTNNQAAQNMTRHAASTKFLRITQNL